jgi:hypothetical protein
MERVRLLPMNGPYHQAYPLSPLARKRIIFSDMQLRAAQISDSSGVSRRGQIAKELPVFFELSAFSSQLSVLRRGQFRFGEQGVKDGYEMIVRQRGVIQRKRGAF